MSNDFSSSPFSRVDQPSRPIRSNSSLTILRFPIHAAHTFLVHHHQRHGRFISSSSSHHLFCFQSLLAERRGTCRHIFTCTCFTFAFALFFFSASILCWLTWPAGALILAFTWAESAIPSQGATNHLSWMNTNNDDYTFKYSAVVFFCALANRNVIIGLHVHGAWAVKRTICPFSLV